MGRVEWEAHAYLMNLVSEFCQARLGPNTSKSTLNGMLRMFVIFTSCTSTCGTMRCAEKAITI